MGEKQASKPHARSAVAAAAIQIAIVSFAKQAIVIVMSMTLIEVITILIFEIYIFFYNLHFLAGCESNEKKICL